MVLRGGRRRQPEVREPVEAEPPDPLLRALAPPADETPAQRAVREAEEEEARLVSERIDDEIRRGCMLERGKTPVKVVLLGPEWSGKAAFLTDFWKAYAPHAWREELLVWSTVIRLYLVRSVTKILDVLDRPPETPHLLGLLRVRLSPLRRAQRDLEELLGLAEGEVMSATAVSKLAKPGRHGTGPRLEEVVELITASRDDMAVLWEDEDVRAKLGTHATALDEQSRFFLDNIKRITERGYEPSDVDVTRVRSRCSTVPGFPEYHVTVETGEQERNEWIFYDVGWPSTHRASPAWIPYLADVNTIVFHVPISAFDERLDEDRHINRLGDCFRVWTMICKSKLIAKVQLTLILTGFNILRDKLGRGISLRQYITSYGDRANDVETVTQYIRTQFLTVSRKVSPESRTVHVHLAADSDSCGVSIVVARVREGIIANNLRNHDLL